VGSLDERRRLRDAILGLARHAMFFARVATPAARPDRTRTPTRTGEFLRNDGRAVDAVPAPEPGMKRSRGA
jgi:hypothetical protein